MTVLAFPTLRLTGMPSFQWGLVSNTQVFSSPLSGAVQTLETPGQRWRVAIALQTADAESAALLRAFLVGLRGRSGRFTLHNLARGIAPRGAATGSPIVNGNGQTGGSLVTAGWTPNVAGIMKAGDFFSTGGELKMLLADASSDSSGNATLSFGPPLRAAPAHASAIVTSMATAQFMLDSDDQGWSTTPPLVDQFNIAATEAWS